MGKAAVYGVIMAGGRGERFWPVSTEKKPKPFLKIFGTKTLIQQTVERVFPLIPGENLLVVLGKEHLEIALGQLKEIPRENFLLEPMGKDTAACIGLASLYLERYDPEAIMVVLPADHYISDTLMFRETLSVAIEACARSGNLVTLGIKPTRPETGYGYILKGSLFNVIKEKNVHYSKGFFEKPDRDTALRYLEDGNYYWNSGIFIWKNKVIQALFAKFMPELWQGLQIIRERLDDPNVQSIIRREYEKFQRISIDYGIMEKAENVLMIPTDFSWDDVGSWAALERVFPKDEQGNVVVGNHIGIDTEGCIIYSPQGLVTTLGISDLVIVYHQGKCLICHRERAQDVKKLLALPSIPQSSKP